jgi:hypothetical protein
MENGPLAPAAGNGRRMRTIEFDEADAPMLAAAMRLAAGTALTYGEAQARARQRFKHYRELFLQFAPPEAAMFQDEETWCEIAIAMDHADCFEVAWEKGRWPDYGQGRATVTVGRRAWATGYSVKVSREDSVRLATALSEMAPIGCELRTPVATDEPA